MRYVIKLWASLSAANRERCPGPLHTEPRFLLRACVYGVHIRTLRSSIKDVRKSHEVRSPRVSSSRSLLNSSLLLSEEFVVPCQRFLIHRYLWWTWLLLLQTSKVERGFHTPVPSQLLWCERYRILAGWDGIFEGWSPVIGRTDAHELDVVRYDQVPDAASDNRAGLQLGALDSNRSLNKRVNSSLGVHRIGCGSVARTNLSLLV